MPAGPTHRHNLLPRIGTTAAPGTMGRGWLAALLAALLMRPRHGFPFVDLPYADLVARIRSLDGAFAQVRSAADLFGSEFALKEGDHECSALVIDIGGHISVHGHAPFTHTQPNATAPVTALRPTILISGEIHGDERVGPLSSLHTAELLVWAAECRVARSARHCALLPDRFPGLLAQDVDWLAHLATSRQTLVVPALNCLGHIAHRRADLGGVDPNRDFPYSRRDTRCLRSPTARVLAQLLLRQRVLVVLTFHGGMEAIAYEWGSPNHPTPADGSPDEHAHRRIAELLRDAAGAFPSVPAYPVGRMNSLVYPVDGGMEDWLYAGGWDRAQARACAPLPGASTDASRADPRALVFLVETSDQKLPPATLLGASDGVLVVGHPRSGHVGRNIRLALTAVDLVQPYVCWAMVDVADAPDGPVLSWYVGGAATVDATFVTVQRWREDLHELGDDELRAMAAGRALAEGVALVTPRTSGGSRWAGLGQGQGQGQGQTAGSMSTPLHVFTHALRGLSSQEYVVQAWAAVDGDFGAANQGHPMGPPQSHLARMRAEHGAANASTAAAAGGGRLFWPSTPLRVSVGDTGTRIVGAHLFRLPGRHKHTRGGYAHGAAAGAYSHTRPADELAHTRGGYAHSRSSFTHCTHWPAAHVMGRDHDRNEIETETAEHPGLRGANDTAAASAGVSPSEGGEEAREEQQEVRLVSLETRYVAALLALLVVGAGCSLVLDRARRQRIYSSVSSNRYLSLPTGFQRQ